MMKNLVFKDQPWGKCPSCKWNSATTGFKCDCPVGYITNLICLLKVIMVLVGNLEEDSHSRNMDDQDTDDNPF